MGLMGPLTLPFTLAGLPFTTFDSVWDALEGARPTTAISGQRYSLYRFVS